MSLSSAGILALRLVQTAALPSGNSDAEGASPPTVTAGEHHYSSPL